MPGNLSTTRYQFCKEISAELVGNLATSVVSSFELSKQQQQQQQQKFNKKNNSSSSNALKQIDVSESVLIATENFKTKVFEINDLTSFTPFRYTTMIIILLLYILS